MEISDEIKFKELEIKKMELELKKTEIQNQKSIWIKFFNPFSTSILVALIGGLYSIYSLNKQKSYELNLAQQEYEQKLYSQAMNSGSMDKACEIIKFYNAIGQLKANDKIALCDYSTILSKKTLSDSVNSIINSNNELMTASSNKATIPILNQSDNKLEQAKQLESEGFIFLLNNDIKAAIEAFEKSENIYPSYHNVYEISKFLKMNLEMNPDLLRKTIKEKYSWGAPKEVIDKY